MRKEIFTEGVVRHLNRFPRETVDTPSPGTLKSFEKLDLVNDNCDQNGRVGLDDL